jgi:hypothetical protein
MYYKTTLIFKQEGERVAFDCGHAHEVLTQAFDCATHYTRKGCTVDIECVSGRASRELTATELETVRRLCASRGLELLML